MKKITKNWVLLLVICVIGLIGLYREGISSFIGIMWLIVLVPTFIIGSIGLFKQLKSLKKS